MTEKHPTHFNVTVERNNTTVHVQDAETRAEAEELARRFEGVSGTSVTITEVHSRAESDLTTHTREMLDDLRP